MNYETMRHFADSWGLVIMTLCFLGFIGWTFRSGASADLHDAAHMIFRDEDNG